MVSTSIEDLFDNDRLPGGLALIPLLVYFPFGVLLTLFRICVGLQAFLIACVLPKVSSVRSSIMRVLCGILGIIVTKEGSEHRDRNVKVLVANYTTTLDHLAVDLAIPCYLPCVWDLPPALMWLLGYTDLGAKQGRETLIQNAKSRISSSDVPILTFPEGASTNGKVGLLKFSVWPFSLDQPVQPVIIKVSRPSFTQVSPSILGGRWWIDVLWFLFVPYTVFHIRILPSKKAPEASSSSASDFSRSVQQFIASEMGIHATTHTSADKVEYAKRKLHVPPAPASGSQSPAGRPSPSSHVETMARQVKDVLPHVPLDAIMADLSLTKDVDLTITNLLEGRFPVVSQSELPSPAASSSSSANSSVASSPTATQPKQSGQSFWRDSKTRQLSLEERKQELLATARQRYMAKHGML